MTKTKLSRLHGYATHGLRIREWEEKELTA
jgi:hypothetical protein